MIKEITQDKKRLSIPCLSLSTKKYIDDTMQEITTDLLDTTNHHKNNCAGLAANQISYYKRIIVVKINGSFVPMVNPEFIVLYGGYKSLEESCLSFPGKWTKKRRYKKVKISYFDPLNMIRVPCLKLKGFGARIVQHEIDHLNGVLI